jgi:hypothetical protein
MNPGDRRVVHLGRDERRRVPVRDLDLPLAER